MSSSGQSAATGGAIAILVGSARQNSASRRAAVALATALQNHGYQPELIDPRAIDMSLPGLEASDALAKQLQAQIQNCRAVAMITPEYDGSVSSVMKLLIEHLGYPSVLKSKPCIILGVASGRIGALKAMEHLRSICDHIGAVVAPGSRTLAEVHRLFDEQGHLQDPQAQAVVTEVALNLDTFLGRYQTP